MADARDSFGNREAFKSGTIVQRVIVDDRDAVGDGDALELSTMLESGFADVGDAFGDGGFGDIHAPRSVPLIIRHRTGTADGQLGTVERPCTVAGCAACFNGLCIGGACRKADGKDTQHQQQAQYQADDFFGCLHGDSSRIFNVPPTLYHIFDRIGIQKCCPLFMHNPQTNRNIGRDCA